MFPRNRLFVKLLIRYGCSFIFICFIFNYFGVLTHLFEENFYENFHYPYDGDVLSQCYLLRHGQKPEVEPINNQTYSCRHNNDRKCKDEFGQSPINPHLLIIVKSKNSHFDKRNAIRNSWGFERRFSDVVIRTIFTLGIDQDTHDGNPSEIQKLVDLEAERFQDIIQVRRQIVTDCAIFLHLLPSSSTSSTNISTTQSKPSTACGGAKKTASEANFTCLSTTISTSL